MSLEMYRGDSFSQKFLVTTSGTPLDISAALLTFTVKTKEKDTTAVITRKNLAAGGAPSEIEMTDPTNGKFTVHLIPANTASLPGNFKFWYDIEMVLTGAVRTIIKNRLNLIQDITT